MVLYDLRLEPSHAKISKLELSTIALKDIFRFDVQMNYAFGVKLLQAKAYVSHDSLDNIFRKHLVLIILSLLLGVGS